MLCSCRSLGSIRIDRDRSCVVCLYYDECSQSGRLIFGREKAESENCCGYDESDETSPFTLLGHGVPLIAPCKWYGCLMIQ